ncbi:hypothetical protein A6395_09625 [Exiguobacterium sp. SH31]|uniref:hypothetical protein n=1 Tax=unclassified Exiguobacterium TaxID=2644629 RepID=UPI0008D182CA|nr:MULTISPECIES: hypothetical protein [unclassified Exiguobacterium]OGX78900.1 hypothetical protein A6395_09625 [Exiguobacterium sp. SH31]TCI67647.1 hypothetical protein EVJ22_13720 [Exiguobacterium sp. SH0S7]
MFNTLAFGEEVYIDSTGMGDSFFGEMPIFFLIFILAIVTVIVIAIISGIRHQVKTGSLLKDMQRFASDLADYPDDASANRLADYLRDVKSFPVHRTQMEPFRVALGSYQLVMESPHVGDETKERVDRQYKRLGILDGEKFADEPAPRRRSGSHHHDHHNHHNDHHHM